MTSKVIINIHEGTIHIEGETDFVKEVYSDFKEQIAASINSAPQVPREPAEIPFEQKQTKTKTRKRSSSKKSSSSESQSSGINPDNPSLDKNLNTTGLREFYAQYEPKNHPEKILIFMRFLKDKIQIETPNTDQIYTCYNAVGEKPAAAFAQSFRDTSSRKNGFIDYNSASDIALTFIGNRHFDHDLKKKEAE